MLSTLDQWLGQHSGLLGALIALSLGLLLLSIVATPWLVARLPRDYLQRDAATPHGNRIVRVIVGALKTIVGSILIVAGLIMLIVPGPGLITLLIGLSITPFPGKQYLFRRLAAQHSVFKSLNWMRMRHGQAPLLHPYATDVEK